MAILAKKTYLETSRAPINKLDGPLGLDDTDGSIDILGDNITTVQHAARPITSSSHVFTNSESAKPEFFSH